MRGGGGARFVARGASRAALGISTTQKLQHPLISGIHLKNYKKDS